MLIVPSDCPTQVSVVPLCTGLRPERQHRRWSGWHGRSRKGKLLTRTVLYVCGLAVALVGCGGASERAGCHGAHLTDRQAIGIKYGETVAAVEERICEPGSEARSDDTVTLTYPSWQFIFEHGGLSEKRKESRPHGQRLKGRTLSSRVVWTVKRGMSLRRVRMLLGTPDADEAVFRQEEGESHVLWYGPWELTFVAGRLSHRTSY